MPPALVLRWPRPDEEDEFMRAHRATTPGDPNFLHDFEEGMSLARYLDMLDERERGLNLPPDHVPTSFLFAFDGDRIVGRVSIRHRLNDVLRLSGGHIGYVVVPEFRRQGYATAMLRLALRFAHDRIGLDRVLVTCDDDNVGSIRTIESNGGVLEDVVRGSDVDKPRRRYWIDVRRRFMR
jgi:predicted acetyltransferase